MTFQLKRKNIIKTRLLPLMNYSNCAAYVLVQDIASALQIIYMLNYLNKNSKLLLFYILYFYFCILCMENENI